MGRKAKLVATISGAQIGSVVFFSVLVWSTASFDAAISALLGGAAGWLGGLLGLIRPTTEEVISSEVFLKRYFAGQMLKLLTIALLIAAIFVFLTSDPFWVIAGLAISQLTLILFLPFIRRLNEI